MGNKPGEFTKGVSSAPSNNKHPESSARQDLTILNQIINIFHSAPDEEMYAKVLRVVLKVMKSKYGVFGYIDHRGVLVCPSMTRDIWDKCMVIDKVIEFPRNTWGGLWGQALKEKKVLSSNGPFNTPEGHIPITRALTAPLIHQEKLIGLLHVANKQTDYTSEDHVKMIKIAAQIAPILHARLQRDKHKQELGLEEKKAQTYLDLAGIIFVALDTEQKVTLINKKGCQILGYKENEIIGKNWFDNFVPTRIAPKVKTAFKQLMTGEIEPVEHFENPVITKSGEERTIVWHNTILKDETDKIVSTLSAGDDVTEQKQAGEELSKYRYHLEELVKERTQDLTEINKQLKQEISEREKAEQALNKSEERLRLVMEATEDSIWEWDMSSGKVTYDQRWPLFLGYKPGEIDFNFDWWKESVHPDSIPAFEKALKNYLEGNTCCYELEYQMKTKSGEWKWIWVRGKCVEHDSQGRPTKMIGTHRDISRRKKTEEEFKRFKFISENASDVHFLVDRDARFKYVNKSACKLFGYSESEFLKLAVPDVDIVYDISKYKKLFNLIQKKTIPPIETINKRKDGTTFPAEITVTGYEINQQPFMFAALHDISKRKQVEEALKKEQIFTENAINAQTDTLFVFDPADGTPIRWNKRFNEVSGYSDEEIKSMKIVDFYEGKDLELMLKSTETALKEGQVTVELYLKTKNGNCILYEYSGVLMRNEDGQDYICAVGRDISERKRAEEALKKHQKEIEELNLNLEKQVIEEVDKSRQKDLIVIQQARLAAMGEMIGLIAHQWRQPLSALNLIYYNIQDLYDNDTLSKELLNDLTAKGISLTKQMSTTIDEFRNFFAPGKKTSFSINKVIKDTLMMVEASLRHNNISIKIKEQEEATTVGYPNEYSHVVLNIINNAKDAIIAKKKHGAITIKIFEEQDSAVVKINDNGGGIPNNILNKLFTPYHTSKETKGTGLGLYVSKMIVEGHMGGHISGKNIKNGAEFVITTPIKTKSTELIT